MSFTPRRSPRVTLPPRTREFNPLESHSRGGGCLAWLMIIVAGLITGTLIALATMYFTDAPLPFLAQANLITATPSPARQIATVNSPPADLPTLTSSPSATDTPTLTRVESPTLRPTRAERTATPLPSASPTLTATLAPTLTPTLGSDLEVLKIEYVTDPPPSILASKRTFTFYVTFQNPAPSDYAITWGVALFPANSPNALNPFGQSSPLKTSLPSGVSKQASGIYQLQSGGEQVCFIARVFQEKDDNPLTVMEGVGQNLNFCVGN